MKAIAFIREFDQSPLYKMISLTAMFNDPNRGSRVPMKAIAFSPNSTTQVETFGLSPITSFDIHDRSVGSVSLSEQLDRPGLTF